MSGLVSFQILQMVYLCQRKQQDEEGEEEGKGEGLQSFGPLRQRALSGLTNENNKEEFTTI